MKEKGPEGLCIHRHYPANGFHRSSCVNRLPLMLMLAIRPPLVKHEADDGLLHGLVVTRALAPTLRKVMVPSTPTVQPRLLGSCSVPLRSRS